MKTRRPVPLALGIALSASVPAALDSRPTAPPASRAPANALFEKSALPFEAPPFDRIRDADFAPALEEGMERHLAEIRTIAARPDPATFENTIVALERSGELLTRAAKVFFNLAQSNTNDTLQKVRSDEAPKLAAHQDAIYLDPKLFERVRALYERREALGLEPQGRYLVERYYRNFVRAGARLSEAEKEKLRALNQEEAKLSTEFAEKVLAGTNASALVLDRRSDLEGLPDAEAAAAADAAKERGLAGKWVLPLQNTTQQPAASNLANRAVRRRLLEASERRNARGDANDTKAIVARLAQLRADKAKLLGFPTWAAYVLDDQMAKTPRNAEKFMTDLVPATTAKARDEAARMQKRIDAEKAGFELSAADWPYYAEKVRKAEYAVDEAQVKPYFELERVLRDGVFDAATKLYGITFKERKDLPVYQTDVRVFEVFDPDGSPLALYYGDYFARSNKSGGAWCDSFVDPSELTKTKPVVVTVTNFTRPASGQPALLSFDDVKTLFHEFGHALHGMFVHPKYPTLLSVPRDFVEFPSQFNEHWAMEPAIFAGYAKHYKTGEPMPADLVEKIRRSRTFNQGYDTMEYLAAALLDLAWHSLPPGGAAPDANTFEQAALARYRVDLPEIPPRYHTTYFSHIWESSYSAGYYAYLWSEVIDHDAYAWFREHGGMTRANGQRFRELVLSRAGTEESAGLYRAFRGREPSVEPLLEERGLKAPPAERNPPAPRSGPPPKSD